jgi:hypothetical protein
MYRLTLVPALIAGALLLTACGADDATRTASTAGTGSATSSAPSSAPLSAPSSAPADGANEEADDDEQPPAGTTPEPTPSPTPGPAAPGTPAPGTAAPSAPGEHAPQDVPPGTGRPDGYPTEVVSSHGAQLWGVYLAAGAADDVWQAHAVGEAEGFLTGQGFTGSGIGSVSCDQGAAEQLGLAPEHDRVAVYFATAEQAQQFVDVYERDTLGTALVTTYCLD